MAGRNALIAGLALVIAAAVACGDDGDGSPAATSTAPAEVEATATPEPPAPLPTAELTGQAELDAVIEAIRSGDPGAIRALIQMTPFECVAERGLPPPPSCPEGVDAGTILERFPSSTCETAMLTEEDLPQLAESIAQQQVYGVYHALEAGFFEETHYVALFTSADDLGDGFLIGLADGAIVSRRSSCGPAPIQDYIADLGLGSPILPPGEE